MIIFPLIAAVIAGVFAVLLFMQARKKRRMSQVAWGAAMAQFSLASLFVAGGIGWGWDPTLYRGFWIFGALLNVPWLALGSVALLGNKLVNQIAFIVVCLLSVYGVIAVFASSPDAAALDATIGMPRGSEVWPGGSSAVLLARLYSIPAWLLVVGIAVWSSMRQGSARLPADRIRGNVLIAIGTTLVAVGGFALSRFGQGEAFSITLALGIGVMFAGFLFASRSPRSAA